MERWSRVLIGRDLPVAGEWDALVQFDRPGKGSLSYLLVSDGEALVVDPPRATEAIVARAAEIGARIVGVGDTHVHADYVSGGPRLAASLGVPYHLHPDDATHPFDGRPGRIDFSPLESGGTIRVGRAVVTVEHTPGHTLGSVSFQAGGCALSGDFVFVSSVGRPDLAGRTEEWTDDLWRSLERARAEWPDERRVHPGHYAGEDERNEDRTIGRPFGEIRRANEPLGIDGEEAFRAWVSARVRPAPEAYRRIKAINIGLEMVTDAEADELEVGRNECACG
jgi:glyoxylase-like metal-dependent hydrolase (beta-lactamase superfamily II)